jgi:hypothetical protein
MRVERADGVGGGIHFPRPRQRPFGSPLKLPDRKVCLPESTGAKLLVCSVWAPTGLPPRVFRPAALVSRAIGLTAALIRTYILECFIGADGQPILTPKPPVPTPEIAQNGPEIGQIVSDSGPSPIPAPARDCRIVLRVTPEFMGWSQGLAEHCSLNVTQLVVQGLIRLAEGSGYHHKIPTRYVPKNPGRRRSYPRPSYS